MASDGRDSPTSSATLSSPLGVKTYAVHFIFLAVVVTAAGLLLAIALRISRPTRELAAAHLPAQNSGQVHRTAAECQGPCGKAYIRKLAALSDAAARNARRALCKLPDPVRVSDKALLIDAAQGTTATQSFATALAVMGLRILHAEKVYNGYDNDKGRARVVDSKNDMWGHVDWTAFENACHFRLDRTDYVKRLEPYDAVMDAQIGMAWFDIYRAFPNSKVVFTDRNASKWAEVRLAHPRSALPYLRPCAGESGEKAWKAVGPEKVTAMFEATREFAQCIVPPERFLLVNIFDEAGDAPVLWKKLADFVGTKKAQEIVNAGCEFPVGRRMHCPAATW